ncbi:MULTISPECIES: transcriptional repressor LexA [Streptomyces]|uniref:LexA repressor n=1 Tax=Streptomyces luteosporeus TaxID=173856 RepID=A0ABN3TXT6_9ACTN
MHASTILPGRPPGNGDGSQGLTVRQRAVLACISESVRTRGYPPSMQEIGDAVSLASTSSVAHQLKSLQRMGFLQRDPHRPRAYVLAPRAQALASTHPLPPPHDAYPGEQAEPAAVAQVPLLDRIAAGSPVLTDQDVQEVLPMPRHVVGDGELFALTVVGQSMIDAGIREGDIVTVRRQSAAEPGDIVAVLLDGGEVTVKKLRIADDGVWLMPCNLAYSPLRLENRTILGKVVAVLRSL